MTRPRKALISIDDTPYYHITSRCVRRAFLCGEDKATGHDYAYRKQWIVERIRLLSSLFAIDICAYAVLSNHYHIVLRISPEQLENDSNDDIITRWCSIYKGPRFVQRYRAGDTLSGAELLAVSTVAEVWRERLGNVSWFMKCLNESVARQANFEDQCKGHFWESRFKSQALSSEEALLSAMAYVDLNPVRAKLASTPEASDFTSLQERIKPRFDGQKAITTQIALGAFLEFFQPIKPMLNFNPVTTNELNDGLPCTFEAYLELVDWSGRKVRKSKRGIISPSTPSIIRRLGIDEKRWLSSVTSFEAMHDHRFSRSMTRCRAS